jgi:hypothetical protein
LALLAKAKSALRTITATIASASGAAINSATNELTAVP